MEHPPQLPLRERIELMREVDAFQRLDGERREKLAQGAEEWPPARIGRSSCRPSQRKAYPARKTSEQFLGLAFRGGFDVIHHGLVVDTLVRGQLLGISVLWGGQHTAELRPRILDASAPLALRWDLACPAFKILASSDFLQGALQHVMRVLYHQNKIHALYRYERDTLVQVALRLQRLAGPENRPVSATQVTVAENLSVTDKTIRDSLGKLEEWGVVGQRPVRNGPSTIEVINRPGLDRMIEDALRKPEKKGDRTPWPKCESLDEYIAERIRKGPGGPKKARR